MASTSEHQQVPLRSGLPFPCDDDLHIVPLISVDLYRAITLQKPHPRAAVSKRDLLYRNYRSLMFYDVNGIFYTVCQKWHCFSLWWREETWIDIHSFWHTLFSVSYICLCYLLTYLLKFTPANLIALTRHSSSQSWIKTSKAVKQLTCHSFSPYAWSCTYFHVLCYISWTDMLLTYISFRHWIGYTASRVHSTSVR